MSGGAGQGGAAPPEHAPGVIPNQRLSFKGPQGFERQVEILRAAKGNTNIFMYGKKQEAWQHIVDQLNPNPLFSGKLSWTTAKDKFEEMKAGWIAKNGRAMMTGQLPEPLNDADKTLRELIHTESEMEENRKSKRPKTKDHAAKFGLYGAEQAIYPAPTDQWGIGASGGAIGFYGAPAAEGPVAPAPAMIGPGSQSQREKEVEGVQMVYGRAMLMIDTLVDNGSLNQKQGKKLRGMCLWQRSPLGVLMYAYGNNPDVFCSRCKELLESMENPSA